MSLKMKLVGLLSVATLALMAGCSSNESNENKVTNNSDKEVVVATSVAVTEILDKLGVEVSGVPTTSYELPKSVKDATKVGNPMSPDLEIIKSLNPICVVSVDTLGSDFEKKFTENNIPSKFVNLSNVDGLKKTILDLGKEFNKKEKAKAIIEELEKKEKELTLNNKKNDEEVLILFGAPGSVMISTDLSYVGNLVKIAGGNNIFESKTSSFMQVNMEEIIKRNPDKILIMTHAVPEEAKKTVEEEFTKETWKQLDAIKNNKVYYLENGYFGMSANLKVIEALDKMGEILNEQ
ncbi:heme ABC transporter substrate-binding protein IsdE [Terrisporobacter petrolearius]|uniref:heme ABC transporter substrate-binding protein IsdE n=1 Tax=Terrisporobacter petrolearius TaxID=1460447 RepID=UPI001D169EE6|nr:heme ABC transporter substrate-binding protein IsdE [Terrisporobacter petrolearius]MCC3863048.1 heme ABC transporter substrate-binding protein IsdE [Terrisporobacter petrolearius]